MRTAAMPTVCAVQHQHCKGKHSVLHSVHYILPHCHTSGTSQGFVQTRSFTSAAVNFTVRSACPAAARRVTSAAALSSHHELRKIHIHASRVSLAVEISAVTPACPAACTARHGSCSTQVHTRASHQDFTPAAVNSGFHTSMPCCCATRRACCSTHIHTMNHVEYKTMAASFACCLIFSGQASMPCCLHSAPQQLQHTS